VFESSDNTAAAGTGAILGLALAGVVGFALYKGGLRFNMARFFRITGVVLVFVVAGLLASAAHTAHEAGWLNSYQEQVVDLSSVIKPGSVNRDITLNVDFAPMFLDYAGQKTPSEMQGTSFRANLEGHTPKNWRKAMYYRYWMHNDNDHHVPGHYGIRTDRWKLIYYYGKPLNMTGAHPPDTEAAWELYDLRSDPHEMKNLYPDAKYAGTVRDLKAQLDRLQREAGDTAA